MSDYDHSPEDFDDGEHRAVSKSQRKRDSHRLQDLGEELVKLAPAQLSKIPLPDALREAIELAQRISKRGGHKRQLQFIGKLMRDIDATPVQEALDVLLNRDAQAAARLHLIERWRDRLIEEGDEALGELLAQHPDADRQHLRQLVRGAAQERLKNKPPRSARELFRYLRELIGEE